jgi:hypothetical protein
MRKSQKKMLEVNVKSENKIYKEIATKMPHSKIILKTILNQ